MKTPNLIFLVLLIVSIGTAQTTSPVTDAARPAAGWDSLKSMITYPEIARRAGVQGYVNVSVELSETGKVESVLISGYGIFNSNVEEIVKKMKWIPEMRNGKPVKTTVVFELQFQLKNYQDMPKKRVIIIESDVPNK
ncbi:MAG: energy transducer TonB [Bacteroidota bacterium]